jgi:hypothetical protein
MPRTLTRLARLVIAGALVLAALPAAATAAECPDTPSAPVFALFGDTALYSLAPGGDFERSLAWAATGTPTLVERNDPFFLSGPDKTTVRLRGRDTITSPPICVDALRPTLRFVGRALDRGSRLVLEVLWHDAGVFKQDVLEEHPADLWSQWLPSKVVPLGAALPTGDGEVHEVRLRFRLKDAAGEWLVDDVFIDPYRR